MLLKHDELREEEIVTPNIKYVESQILKEEITQTNNMVKILTI